MEQKQRSVPPVASAPENQRSQSKMSPVLSLLRSFLQCWYAFSAPPEVAENADFEARERVRRGRVASLVILGTFLAAIIIVSTILLALPGVFLLQWTLTGTILGILCCLIAIPLNREGNVRIALINSLLIVFDINMQPHSMMWSQMIASQGVAHSLLARPITLYVVVAAVSYLWVRSALTALQRVMNE